MLKLRFLYLIILFPSILFAQQRSKIILEGSKYSVVDTKTNISYIKFPIFRHDNAILTCDSAVFYKDRNYFEAFQHVHINQGDTVNIFSDFLNYDGNTKKAHLSDHVTMRDPTSTLTTNVLDYDMGLKIGTYVDGGKIVNKDVTLTSKRGWYFAGSKDSFFRYNVVVVTPQTTIKSDTLRYNTLTNWTYFYGPTNIKGKDDNLYTENGTYNTKSENAFFGKRNLYTQGTKSLKGDSLLYNGKTGYGRAIKNIIFMDISDKTKLWGQLGEYYKADERIVVTQSAYFAMGTKDSITVGKKKIPDTLWFGADTLTSQRALQKDLKLIKKPVVEKDNEIGVEDEQAKQDKAKEKAEAKKELLKDAEEQKKATEKPAAKKLSRKERKEAEEKAKELKNNPPPLTSEKITDSTKKLLDSTKVVKDSVKIDSVKKTLGITIASEPPSIVKKETVKTNLKIKANAITSTSPATAQIGAKGKTSTVVAKKDTTVFNPADTVRTRIIKAYHNVRVFKSNMQAKADSLFYTAADSVLRWYNNPILWSEGSQQTGDTIHVFFKNDKIHSFQVFQNSFAVNVQTDSTKFNQVKGRKSTGFFVNGELNSMYVDGNAESLYYNKNDKGEYGSLTQTVSSRIRFKFANKELTNIVLVKGNEGATSPMDKLPKETKLTGFIWKPELRPLSKADIIKGKPLKKAAVKPVPKAKPKTESKKPVVSGKKAVITKPLLPAKKLVDSIK